MNRQVDLSSITYFSFKDNTRKKLSDVLDESAVMQVGRSTVMKHSAVRELADSENISIMEILPLCEPTRDNGMKHWITVKVGNGSVSQIATGEADVLNTGKTIGGKYVEVDQIDCKYRGAMAEKRGFDRAVLKLLRIYNIYSDVEAEFVKSGSDAEPRITQANAPVTSGATNSVPSFPKPMPASAAKPSETILKPGMPLSGYKL